MSVNTTRADTFDVLFSTTFDKYRPTLTNNAWDAHPTHYWLNRKGRRRMLDGGPTIVEPLIYGGGHAGWYGENDIVEIQPQTGISAATFDWRSVYATMYLSGKEKLLNSGENQIIALAEAKAMQAEENLGEMLAVSAYKDEPDSADEFFGLGYLIDDHTGDAAKASGAGVDVGGIDSTANDWWRSRVYDGTPTTGDFGAAGLNTGELVRKAIRTARNAASDSTKDKADVAFTTQEVYEAIEDTYVQNVRYEDVDAANAGFDNIRVSKMPLFFDFHCPADTVFGVNSKYLQIVGHKDRWMTASGWSKNPAEGVDSTYSANSSVGGFRDGQYNVITGLGNMTVRNRRRQFRINNIAL